MRAYKFRGMDIQGRWFYGNLAIVPKNTANHKAGHYISNSAGMPFAYQVRPETVGQCTGLTDICDKEIYNGDIITARERSDTAPFKGYVHFLNAQYWVNYIGYESYYLPLIQLHDAQYEPIEVIGNIHSNPDLLEVTE